MGGRTYGPSAWSCRAGRPCKEQSRDCNVQYSWFWDDCIQADFVIQDGLDESRVSVLVLYIMFLKYQFVWQDFVIAEELHVAFLCSKFKFIVLIALKKYYCWIILYLRKLHQPPPLLLAPWGLFFLCLLNLRNFLHNPLLLHQESPG